MIGLGLHMQGCEMRYIYKEDFRPIDSNINLYLGRENTVEIEE